MALEYPGLLPEGAIIHDLLQIREPLASRPWADLYCVRKLGSSLDMLLKLPRPVLALEQQEALRAAFVAEGHALSSLRHPHVLRVELTLEALSLRDSPEAGDARTVHCPAMVADLPQGRGLEELFALTPAIPVRRAVALFLGALEGLAHLHLQGPHGHISAHSLFLVDPDTDDEYLLWMDLGLAERAFAANKKLPARQESVDLQSVALLLLQAWLGVDPKKRAEADEEPLDAWVKAALRERAREERLTGAQRAGLEAVLLRALDKQYSQAAVMARELEAVFPDLGEEEAAASTWDRGAAGWVWFFLAVVVALILAVILARGDAWTGLSGCGAGQAPVASVPAPLAADPCLRPAHQVKGILVPEEMVFVEGDSPRAGGEEGVRDFLLDRCEVTVRRWAACVQAGACEPPSKTDEEGLLNWGLVEVERHPINGVTWAQASAYCASLGKRLPTGAEWERAARGGDGRLYPWGDQEPSCELAHSWTPAEGEGCGEGTTDEVGRRPAGASPCGALDMSGNVWEWVQDSAPAGHIKRGGSWAHPEPLREEEDGPELWKEQLKATFSRVGEQGKAYYNTGLRCARDAR